MLNFNLYAIILAHEYVRKYVGWIF